MPNNFHCRYCGRHLPTTKGLNLHITNTQSCRESWKRILARRNDQTAGGVQQGADTRPTSDVEMDDVQNPLFEPASPDITGPPTTREDHHDKPSRWIETYHISAGATYRTAKTYFAKLREEQIAKGEEPYAPFESEEEWELAE